jgi:hypothetical protein
VTSASGEDTSPVGPPVIRTVGATVSAVHARAVIGPYFPAAVFMTTSKRCGPSPSSS